MESPVSTAPLVAAVTAAGASERMGSPKALLPWRGTTILAHIVATLQDVGVDPVLVVTGARGREIASEATRAGARPLHNDGWQHGRFGSVQAAARFAFSHSARTRLLLWPVDCPAVSAATVRHLIDAARVEEGNLVPSYAGRAGHPVVLCPETVAQVSGAARDSNLRQILYGLSSVRRFVEVDDPAVVANLNTRDDYEAARGVWTKEAAK